MAVDINGGIVIGGDGGVVGSVGGGGVVVVVVVVVVGVRGGDVDAGKAFQGGEESGRDGGPHPGRHLIDKAAVVLHRRRPILSFRSNTASYNRNGLSFCQRLRRKKNIREITALPPFFSSFSRIVKLMVTANLFSWALPNSEGLITFQKL